MPFTRTFIWRGCAASLVPMLGLFACIGLAAQPAPANSSEAAPVERAAALAEPLQAPPDKRLFGVLPNYRTADQSKPFAPLTVKQKFTIAFKDSFDKPIYAVSGAFAALGQLDDQHPQFGQGMAGFGKRYVTGYADQAIGNIMTEGLFPAMLHEDPRYFRRSEGSKWGRTGYAVTRIFVTRTDQNKNRFNFSEVVGNSAAVAASQFYYSDSRTASDAIQKLATQLATDAFSNVLKEFWPDIKHRYFSKRHATAN